MEASEEITKIDIKQAIKAIVQLKQRLARLKKQSLLRIANKLLGSLGELYVMSELQEQGYQPQLKGGQAGYDIFLDDKPPRRIEVKTSVLKKEGVYSEVVLYFGWKVESWNQKKKNKYDVLVCVAMNDCFKKHDFYIFSREDISRLDSVPKVGRFTSVKKKIHLFENKKGFQKAVKEKPAYVTSLERVINKNPQRFRNQWDKIKN